MTYFTETTRGRRIVAAIDHHTDKIEAAAFELYEDRWCANRKTLHRLTGTMKWADQDVVVRSLAIFVECVHAAVRAIYYEGTVKLVTEAPGAPPTALVVNFKGKEMTVGLTWNASGDEFTFQKNSTNSLGWTVRLWRQDGADDLTHAISRVVGLFIYKAQ